MKQEPIIHRRDRVWTVTLGEDGKLQAEIDAELLARLRQSKSAYDVNEALRQEIARTRTW